MFGMHVTRRRSRRTPVRQRRSQLGGNPYSFLGSRPFREDRLRSYLVSQHRTGRRLSSIVDDPYVRRCGGESLLWKVLRDPRTIEALDCDIRDAITRGIG